MNKFYYIIKANNQTVIHDCIVAEMLEEALDTFSALLLRGMVCRATLNNFCRNYIDEDYFDETLFGDLLEKDSGVSVASVTLYKNLYELHNRELGEYIAKHSIEERCNNNKVIEHEGRLISMAFEEFRNLPSDIMDFLISRWINKYVEVYRIELVKPEQNILN